MIITNKSIKYKHCLISDIYIKVLNYYVISVMEIYKI